MWSKKFKKGKKVLVSNDKINWYDAYYISCDERCTPYVYEVHYGDPWRRVVRYKYCKKYTPEGHKYGPEIGHVVR